MPDCLGQDTLVASVEALSATLSGDSVKVALNTNNVLPTPTTVGTAILTEPVGSWYSRKTGTPFTTYVDGSGNTVLEFTDCNWPYTGSDAAETIYGFALITDVSSVLQVVSMAALAEPVVMGVSLNAITVKPEISFPPIGQS